MRSWWENEKPPLPTEGHNENFLFKPSSSLRSEQVPDVSLWGKGWWLQPLCPWHPQPGSHCSASLPARLRGEPQSTSVLPKHSSVNPSNDFQGYQLSTSHALSPTFQIFNLKVYCDWDKGGYLLVDWLLRSYQPVFQHHKWKCEKLTHRNKPVED